MLTQAIGKKASFICAMLCLAAGPLLAGPILSIEPSFAVVRPGQPFLLDIFISGVTDLYAFQFDLSFRPLGPFSRRALSADAVIEGSFLGTGGSTLFIPGAIDNSLSTISFTAGSLIGPVPGVSGSGALASILSTPLAFGIVPVRLRNVLLLDSTLSEIPVGTQTGFVAVVPEPNTSVLLITGGLFILAGRHRAA